MPAPPIQGSPSDWAADASPNMYSAAQSEMPGSTVLSVGEASQLSPAASAGAGAAAAVVAERATAELGTRRMTAGSSLGDRAWATERPSVRPLARVILAERPIRRRPSGAMTGRRPSCPSRVWVMAQLSPGAGGVT